MPEAFIMLSFIVARILLGFLYEEYLCWEVVAVAVQEDTRTIGTQRISLSVTLLCLEEVSVERFRPDKGELWLVLAVTILSEEATAHNLVEEVPLSTISEGTYTPCKDIPEWVKHIAWSIYILDVTFSTHTLGTSLVHWVIVKVTHEYDTDVLAMHVNQRVDSATAHHAGSLTFGARLLLSSQTRGPVIHYHSHSVAR